MKFRICLFVIFIGLVFFSGCTQIIEENFCSDCPECEYNEETCAGFEKEVEVVAYVCPDGETIVDNSSYCPSDMEAELELPYISDYIDRVYIREEENGEEPSGSAIVAGKNYRVIAENEEGFEGYAQFTLIIDEEITAKEEEYCPDSCIDENTYYMPLMIMWGNYSEIKILVEDAGGSHGESITYTFVDSEGEASYLAEMCDMDENLDSYECIVNSRMITMYGGTILNGWLEGSVINPYNVSSNYRGLCSAMIAKTSAMGFTGRHYARAGCDIVYGCCPGVESTRINQESCTCNCTMNVSNLEVNAEINVTFPNWLGYTTVTQCEQEHWDEFLQNLKTHEEGHISICKEDRGNMENSLRPAKASAEGNSCNEACNTAVERLEIELEKTANQVLTDSKTKQDKYDNDTQHGRTQGATLNCYGC